MIRLKTVLVASDFSSASEAALGYGRELARTFGAKLRVVHVADNMITRYAFEGGAPLPFEVQVEYEQATRERVNGLLREDDRRELRAEAVLRTSNVPADAIVEEAKDSAADILVVGTHGRGVVAHFFLGSVAERVVRLAPCPVLTVRNPEHEFLTPDAVAVVARAHQ
jgi:nucleotide-binding universal stress UspA family protein